MESRTYMLAAFDVTGLSEKQRSALALEVAVQAEEGDEHPGVPEPAIAFSGDPTDRRPSYALPLDQATALAEVVKSVILDGTPTDQLIGIEVDRDAIQTVWLVKSHVFDHAEDTQRCFISMVDENGSVSSIEEH